MNGWQFDPLEICALALAGALHWRRARTLAHRGRPVPKLRLASFAAGLLTVLLVLGLDGRLLRPLLRVRLVHRLRVLAHPLVALPLWAANFVVWHLPALFDVALRDDGIHALQHTLFVALGMLMWAALVEPLPGPAWFTAPWKIPYVLAMWLVMLVLSQVFIWSSHVYYAPYAHDATLWGLSHLADQKAGGGVMLVESAFTMLPALVWVLLQVLRESEARQRLVDAGVAPAAAARAARYGRA
jgi:putative membrane protein